MPPRPKTHPATNESLTTLDPNIILQQELEIIRWKLDDASQFHRHFSTVYFGGIATIIGSLFIQPQRNTYFLIYNSFAALFLVFCVFGISVLYQIIRTRIEWYEAMYAWEQIKEYYINHLSDSELYTAFKEKKASIPNLNQPGSMNNISLFQIMLFNTTMFGWAIFYVGLAFDYYVLGIAILGAVIFYAIMSFLIFKKRRSTN